MYNDGNGGPHWGAVPPGAYAPGGVPPGAAGQSQPQGNGYGRPVIDPFAGQPQLPITAIYNDPQLLRDLAEVKEENFHLKNQLDAAKEKARAFGQIIELAENATSIICPGGGRVILLPYQFERVEHIYPEAVFRMDSYYILRFRGGKIPPLQLSEEEVSKDKLLLPRLDEHTGMLIRRWKSRAETADLVRRAIAMATEEVNQLFYGGWLKVNERMDFLQFQGFQTCFLNSDGNKLEKLEDTFSNPVTMGQAAEAFVGSFLAIADPAVRAWLFLSAHVGALFSLLDAEKYPVKAGLSITCSSVRVQGFLDSLLQIYEEPALAIEVREVDFRSMLLRHKDSCIRILDERPTERTSGNWKVLGDALSTGGLELDGTDPFSLQGLPVVISRYDPVGACEPYWVSLDIGEEDIRWDMLENDMPSAERGKGYWIGFLRHVAKNLNEFEADLVEGKKWALTHADPESPASAISVLTALRAVMSLVKRYWKRSFMPSCLDDLVSEDFLDAVPVQVRELVEKELPDGSLAERVLHMLRRALHSGALTAVHRDEYTKGDGRTMFFDDDCAYIPSGTLSRICKEWGLCRPRVAKSLNAAGLTLGAKENANALLTRSYGVRCLKLPRSVFEMFGEPSPFGGGVG